MKTGNIKIRVRKVQKREFRKRNRVRERVYMDEGGGVQNNRVRESIYG